mmetsp:Transcript_13883/g.43703  ORF Transcript_13883/g.43703 Transcript_13883/m.43703 type:complete len:200 (+) Transcript_13883:972-1571(+)
MRAPAVGAGTSWRTGPCTVAGRGAVSCSVPRMGLYMWMARVPGDSASSDDERHTARCCVSAGTAMLAMTAPPSHAYTRIRPLCSTMTRRASASTRYSAPSAGCASRRAGNEWVDRTTRRGVSARRPLVSATRSTSSALTTVSRPGVRRAKRTTVPRRAPREAAAEGRRANARTGGERSPPMVTVASTVTVVVSGSMART